MKFKMPTMFKRLISKKVFQSGFLGGSYSWKSVNEKAYAQEGYIVNNVGFRCVSLISKNLGAVPFIVKQLKGDKLEPVPNHPLQELLINPNPNDGGVEFFTALTAFREITGNTFLYDEASAKGIPKELWIAVPFHTKVITNDKTPIPLGYVFDDGKVKRAWMTDIISGQSNMLHWKTFNPFSVHRGLSPFAAAAFSVDIFNKSSIANKALLDNDSRPSGILSSEQDINLKQYEDLKEMMDDYNSGPKAEGKFLTLGKGLKWQQLGLTPKDMDWMKSRGVTAGDITSVFGVPNQLLGLPGSQTFANYAQARLAFWEDTVLPTLDSLVAELNNWLVPKYKEKGLVITYETANISALEPRRKEKWDAIGKADWITPNEKRIATGFPKKDDPAFDEVYISAGLLPIGIDVFQDMDATGQKALIQAYVSKGLSRDAAEAKVLRILDYRGPYQSKK